jgi:hypothetical protein
MGGWRLPHISGFTRVALWILLLVLTSLIFLYPTHMGYELQTIQSLYVFNNLYLFSALYYVWIAILLLLLFAPRVQDDHDWEKLGLVCLFSLVTFGFWVHLHQGYFGEVFAYASRVNYTVGHGGVPTGSSDFPGMDILGAVFRLVTGLETFPTITVILLFESVLFGALLFIFLRNCLSSSRVSSLAALLVIVGSSELAKYIPQFMPRGFALILLTLILAISTSPEKGTFSKWQERLLFILVFSMLAVTHLMTSVVALLVLFGAYLVARFTKSRQTSLALVVFSFMIIVFWELYFAVTTFEGQAGFFSNMIQRLSEGELLSPYVLSMGQANLGGSVPLWALMIRYFWLGLTVVAGSLVSVRNLIKIRSLTSIETVATGGIVGIGIFLVVSSALSGGVESIRVLLYLPVFTVLTVFLWCRSHPIWMRVSSGVLLTVLIFFLALPTFLVNNDRVRNSTFSSYEMAAGAFVGSQSGQGMTVYNSVYSLLVSYYAPPFDVRYIDYYSLLTAGEGEAGFWQRLDSLVAEFEDPTNKKSRLFQVADRSVWPVLFTYGIDPATDPRWQNMKEELDRENLVYNNAFVQLYQAGILFDTS